MTTKAPAFTVLLPVHRGPELLPFAIESVLAQTRQDFELFVICDGAPLATAACARGYAARDQRIRIFEHGKGERHGERYRDEALSTATGIYVCQIADDDLWFPEHLAEAERLLRDCDFGNLTQSSVLPDGRVVPSLDDLSHRPTVEAMLSKRIGFFGPTAAAYRLDAYRQLDERWSPAPTDIWSDLFMWRKFMRVAHMRIATRHVITSLSLPTPYRLDWGPDERRAESERFATRLKTPEGRSQIRADGLRDIAMRFAEQHSELVELRRRRYFHRAVRKLRRIARRLFSLAAKPNPWRSPSSAK